MEDATVISKLLFHWVTPLMQKGVKGLLNHSDDLFDLPDQISTTAIGHRIDHYLHKTVTHVGSAIYSYIEKTFLNQNRYAYTYTQEYYNHPNTRFKTKKL